MTTPMQSRIGHLKIALLNSVSAPAFAIHSSFAVRPEPAPEPDMRVIGHDHVVSVASPVSP